MSKLTLTTLANLQNDQTATANINNNNAAITAAFDNNLSRDGTTPNTMLSTLDMNSNRILNLPAPASNAEPVRLSDVTSTTSVLVNESITSLTSPYNIDQYGSGSTTAVSANSITSSDSSAESGKERYSLWVGNTSAGTQDGSPGATTFALGVSNIKHNWATSTVAGETGGINVAVRGGDNNVSGSGDCIAYQSNVAGSYANNYIAQHEGVTNYFPAGAVNSSAKSMRTYMGTVLSSDASSTLGFGALAANGTLGTAFLAENFGTNGNSSYGAASTWASAFRHRYDDGTHTAYDQFNVDAHGLTLAGPGTVNTNQKTLRVGGSVTNNLEITNAAQNAVIASLDDLGNLNVNGYLFFTGDPTGSADCSAALTSALATGKVVYIPAGTYKFLSQVSYTIPAGTNAATIIGAGMGKTKLNWPNATNGLSIVYSGVGSTVHLRDLSITTGQVGVQTAVTLTYATPFATPGYNPVTDITNVEFVGNDGYPPTATTKYWGNGLALVNISNVNVTNCLFQGPFGVGGYSTSGGGMSFVGLPASTSYAAAINIAGCSFNLLNAGILYGSYIQGVTVSQSNFTGGTYGILTNPSETGVLSELQIVDSQFNCTYGVYTGTAIAGMGISNNLFLVPASGIGIDLVEASTLVSITGNQIDGIGAGAIGINGAKGTLLNITGNVLANFSSGGTALALTSSVANSTVQANVFNTNATNVTNASTSTTIINNQGYNPVGISAPVTMGTSPVTLTAGASPETHYINQSATNTATVVKGSRTIATLKEASTYYQVQLAPFESYVTTWVTTAPTYTKDVH